MKDINEYINEGIFDNNLNVTPFETALGLKDYQYNTTDGSKDALGNPLKEGDVIATSGFGGLVLGSYICKRGSQVEYWLATGRLSTNGNNNEFHQRVSCSKVIKVDQKNLNI